METTEGNKIARGQESYGIEDHIDGVGTIVVVVPTDGTPNYYNP